MKFFSRINPFGVSGKPTGGNNGDIVRSTTDNDLYFNSGGIWVPLAFDNVAKYITKKYVPSPATNNKEMFPSFGAYTTLAVTAGRCYFMPTPIGMPISLTYIGLEVTTASAGTAEVALYRGDGSNGAPLTRVAYASGIDTGTTGVKLVSIGPISLEPDLYWAAVRCTAAATLRATATSFIIAISGATQYRHLFNSDASLANPVATSPTNLGTTSPLVIGRWS
jgi:hypothetical protein